MQIQPIWQGKLAAEFEKDYFKKLAAFLDQETETIYPAEDLINISVKPTNIFNKLVNSLLIGWYDERN